MPGPPLNFTADMLLGHLVLSNTDCDKQQQYQRKMLIKILLTAEEIQCDLLKQILIINNSIINPAVQNFCLPLLALTVITQTRSCL